MKIKYEDLHKFHTGILRKCNLDDFSNDSVSLGLCQTSLRGVDSHGVRLLPHYVNSALNGRKNPNPKFELTFKYPSIGLLDADNAFGHAAGMKAVDHGMEVADKYGIGVIAVSNSSHPGAMATMALKAADRGYICFAFTHADALILSYSGTRPFFGTNPVCFAAPRKEKDPYCLDMATSTVPWNRVLVHRGKNLPLDEGLAVDKHGNLTTNPHEAVALKPTGGYKGYGLASMVDILCGVYSGMAFGRDILSMYKADIKTPRKLGQFYMVMKTDGAIEADNFIFALQEMTNQVRNEPSIKGEKVMLPGDKEIETAKERLKNGIPLDDITYSKFVELSTEFNEKLIVFDED